MKRHMVSLLRDQPIRFQQEKWKLHMATGIMPLNSPKHKHTEELILITWKQNNFNLPHLTYHGL
jgi:hypothetical protein